MKTSITGSNWPKLCCVFNSFKVIWRNTDLVRYKYQVSVVLKLYFDNRPKNKVIKVLIKFIYIVIKWSILPNLIMEFSFTRNERKRKKGKVEKYVNQANHINHRRRVVLRYWGVKRSLICPRWLCEMKMTKILFVTWTCTFFLNKHIFHLTCLQTAIFPGGMALPFSLAMRVKVAMAFSLFPISTSKRGLSGSHSATQNVQMRVWFWLVLF